MKRILPSKIVVFVFMCISVTFFLIIYFHEEEKRKIRLETAGRLSVLKSIRHAILESNVPFGDLSLFAILGTNNMMGFPFIIPGYDSSDVQDKFRDFADNCDKKSFYDYCQYRLIKDDLNWWGIVELKLGKYNKCFLMLTCDGRVVEIKAPFLPEQLKITPQEYENWGRYRGIVP